MIRPIHAAYKGFPRTLKDTVIDLITVVISAMFILIGVYLALELLDDPLYNKELFIILFMMLFGGGALWTLANIVTGKPRVDLFIDAAELSLIIRGTLIGLIAMMVLACLINIITDRMAILSAFWLSTFAISRGLTVFFAIFAAINEEWAMYNVQRIVTFGQDGELIIALGIGFRALLFTLLHRPYAYAYAPLAFYISLFLSGVVLAYVLADTKRLSIAILCHVVFNIIAVL